MTIDSNSIVLIFSSILWFAFLFIYKIKNGRFTLGYVLIAFYAILSIITIFVFNSEYAIYYYKRDLTYVPALFLFGMMLITFIPIIRLKENNIKYICIPSKRENTLICVVFGIVSLMSIIDLLPAIQNGIAVMLSNDADDITDLYHDFTDTRKDRQSLTGSFSIVGVLSTVSNVFGPLFLYTYLLQKEKNRYVIILISITILHGFLSGVAAASRCKIASSVFILGLLYFFFKPFLEKELKNKIKIVSVVCFGFIFFSLLTITIARVETTNMTSSTFNIGRYLGGAPIVFNNYCMDANGTREGSQTAPLFKKMLGYETLSENDIRYKYRHLRVNNSRFYTYVGDYVLDYGPIVALFVFLLISFIGRTILKNNGKLNFGQVIMVFVMLKFCSAYYQASFTGIGGNLCVIIALLGVLIYHIGNYSSVKIYRQDGK